MNSPSTPAALPRLPPALHALFIDYATVAEEWSYDVKVGQNLPGRAKADRPGLVKLEKAGLLVMYTRREEDTDRPRMRTYINFTQLGCQYSAVHSLKVEALDLHKGASVGTSDTPQTDEHAIDRNSREQLDRDIAFLSEMQGLLHDGNVDDVQIMLGDWQRELERLAAAREAK